MYLRTIRPYGLVKYAIKKIHRQEYYQSEDSKDSFAEFRRLQLRHVSYHKYFRTDLSEFYPFKFHEGYSF